MNREKLTETAHLLAGSTRGILSLGDSEQDACTILAAAQLGSSQENQNRLHQLILDAPHIQEYIAGVLLDPAWFVELAGVEDREIHPVHFDNMLTGIALHGNCKEQGDLKAKLTDWRMLGATFADWETIFPADADPEAVAELTDEMARFAATAQSADLVPMLSVRLEDESAEESLPPIFKSLFAALTRHEVFHQTLLLRVPFLAECVTSVQIPGIPDNIAGLVIDPGSNATERFTSLLECIKTSAPDLPWPVTFCLGHTFEREIAANWSGRGTKEFLSQLTLDGILKSAREALFENEQ